MQPEDVRGGSVRRAGREDVAALTALRAQWQGWPVTDAFSSAFSAWFSSEGSGRWWWLAEDAGGVPVGMVNVRLFERMPVPAGSAGRWGYLSNLFVHPASRGRGLGTRLVGALLATSREAGLVRVVLSPSERSRPLYGRAGFVPADGLLVWHPRTDGDDQGADPLTNEIAGQLRHGGAAGPGT